MKKRPHQRPHVSGAERRSLGWAPLPGHRRTFGFLLVAAFMTADCASCTDRGVHREAIKHHDLGVTYLEQGLCVQAEERCRLALEYGPNFEHPYNCLGMVALSCHGDLEQAAQHFKDALAVNADFAQAHNNLGTVFFRQNPPNYSAACDEYLAALEIDPGYFDARENRGMCLMRQGTIIGDQGDTEGRREHYREARRHLIRLLEMNPENFNARHHLGFMDLIEKKFASAEQNFKRCLEIDPENPICAYNLGNTYLETSRCGEAIQSYITALRSKGANDVAVGARQNLGVAYERCARNDAAIKQFLDRIRLDPGNPTNHFDLGNIYAEKGLPDQAVNEWENTVKLDPYYCPAYYELAKAADKNFETAKTIRLCQDFITCATEVNKDRTVPQWPSQVGECKQLVKKLQME